MAMNWDDFDGDDYLPFAKWQQTKTIFDVYGQESKIIFIEIIANPIKFTNKFGKVQYKIEVQQYNESNGISDIKTYQALNTHCYLAGGIKLITAIKNLIKETKTMCITRLGKGFDTEYFAKTWILTTQTTLDNKKQKSKPNKKE